MEFDYDTTYRKVSKKDKPSLGKPYKVVKMVRNGSGHKWSEFGRSYDTRGLVSLTSSSDLTFVFEDPAIQRDMAFWKYGNGK